MAGMQIHRWMDALLKPWDDIILGNMPLFHVYAQGGVLTTALVGHQPLVLVPNPRDLDDLLADDPQVASGLPARRAHALHCAAQPSKGRRARHLRSLKLCLCGAAPSAGGNQGAL